MLRIRAISQTAKGETGEPPEYRDLTCAVGQLFLRGAQSRGARNKNIRRCFAGIATGRVALQRGDVGRSPRTNQIPPIQMFPRYPRMLLRPARIQRSQDPDPEAQRPLHRLRNPDAWADNHLRIRHGNASMNRDRVAARHRQAIHLAIDPQRGA